MLQEGWMSTIASRDSFKLCVLAEHKSLHITIVYFCQRGVIQMLNTISYVEGGGGGGRLVMFIGCPIIPVDLECMLDVTGVFRCCSSVFLILNF